MSPPDAPEPSKPPQPVESLAATVSARLPRGAISSGWLVIFLAGLIGVLAGFGAALFTWLIHAVADNSVGAVVGWAEGALPNMLALVAVPAAALLFVSWLTRTFAPEAQGHGVPEVITAVARHDGRIRPLVAGVKILASGLCIGAGASVGREGPIVQIGSSLGSTAGQIFKLSARNIKVLVAAGAAAGISATFNAPLAGVMFASEIILGSFAVESLTPIVIASVLADVVQQHIGEHKFEPAFRQLDYNFPGEWQQLPSYLLLGALAGLAAAGFTKLIYWTEDAAERWLKQWQVRALALGAVVGLAGALYPLAASQVSPETTQHQADGELPVPPLMGVGYGVVDHALHLDVPSTQAADGREGAANAEEEGADALADALHESVDRFMGRGKFKHETVEDELDKVVLVEGSQLWDQLWWLLPLVFLKPLMTSLSLAGGGSGGVFAPSLYLGAVLGASFGLVVNAFFPQYSNAPGVYAMVGMGSVVAGTTHGVLSAILIVYEMTGNYQVILPIMTAAGVASVVSQFIEPESIYYKKLSRRGELISRGHDMHRLDHIMVRNVMIREFPKLNQGDNVIEIVRVARANPHIESLPVMDDAGKLIGIIRPTDLHRVLDSDVSPQLINAEDIALRSTISVSPAENLIEALRDFGTRDVETLPVEVGKGENRRLVGLLLRADVMKRYRQEMLARH